MAGMFQADRREIGILGRGKSMCVVCAENERVCDGSDVGMKEREAPGRGQITRGLEWHKKELWLHLAGTREPCKYCEQGTVL